MMECNNKYQIRKLEPKRYRNSLKFGVYERNTYAHETSAHVRGVSLCYLQLGLTLSIT